MTEKDRRNNYKAIFKSDLGNIIMIDLLRQARAMDSLEARCGAMDLMAYIYEMAFAAPEGEET